MARLQRIVASVEVFALIVDNLPIETRQRAEFAAEEVYDGSDPPVYLHYLVTMDESVAAEFDAALANLATLQRRALIAFAAEMRWQREVGGMVAGGVPIATDDRSKLMIAGARLAALANPGWSTRWQGRDGQSYAVDAEAILAISLAVEAHVNAAFARFAEVKDEIDAGTLTTPAQVEAAMAA